MLSLGRKKRTRDEVSLRRPPRWRPFGECLERRLLLSVWGDFNGDGFDDLAVGAPGEALNGWSAAGAVNVVYGSTAGLSDAGNQFWNMGGGLPGGTEEADQFGSALASADFNADGFSDLAIGIPGESLGASAATGGVVVIYGSTSGLTDVGDQFWSQDSPRIREFDETADQFGAALAAGDFNGDGFGDLVIGVPNEDLGNLFDAGSINILYGRSIGLNAAGNQVLNLNVGGVAGTAAVGDRFGSSITAGDFNGDGRDDLVVGVPFADVGASDDAGAFSVLYGTTNGISPIGSQYWHQDIGSVPDLAEAGDEFGASVAAADFNGDGRDDVAIGAPGEDVGSIADAGMGIILYGSSAGVTDANNTAMTQDALGGGNTSEADDRWGSAVAAADFNGDNVSDLAISSPFQEVVAVSDAGSVNVLFGSASGLSLTDSVFVTQETAGEISEASDHAGLTLGAADFNGDGSFDLVVGQPDENIGSVVDGGAVLVLYGGTTFADGEVWSQAGAIVGAPENADHFGGGVNSSSRGSSNERLTGVSATATDPAGNTSEFGPAVTVGQGPGNIPPPGGPSGTPAFEYFAPSRSTSAPPLHGAPLLDAFAATDAHSPVPRAIAHRAQMSTTSATDWLDLVMSDPLTMDGTN
jgi:hypothetical protein